MLRLACELGDKDTVSGSVTSPSPPFPAGDDCVHYVFTPANLRSDGTAITVLIDINPAALAGDRAFELATLLFYLHDHDDIRDLLRDRLVELAGPRAACAYLAQVVLRQVDWPHATIRETRPRGVTCAWPDSITADIDNSPAR